MIRAHNARVQDPYGIAETQRRPLPSLPGEVMAHAGEDEAIDAMLGDLLVHAQNCVRRFGDFQCLMSGSPGGEALLRRMLIDPALRHFPWPRTRVFVTDDALVGESHPRSRSGLVLSYLAENAGIPRSQVHAIPGESASAAEEYAGVVREALGWREKGHDRPDYAMLVLEGDAGVAGLTGAHAHRADEGELIVATPGGVSASLTLLNASRFIGVLVAGERGRGGLDVLRGRGSSPARALRPLEGELRWYLDRTLLDVRGP